ncbi:DNA-3-methyladenine glycosylase [Rhizobium sp. RU36D]|uniref:DNA-3-methyladenine glycosylase n=1 Tax=Rhizobium sp. RU36D TaxID=1907415 RepID=UPI0009D7DE13|nr:DNA-3-methyladenine glycosylase [Rhizobium sp. RU36D]SMC73221.1 DNA-3-methyladenine glycosylase [Rhizobium sp. RU36D]
MSVDLAFFNRDAVSVAAELLGATLLVEGVGGVIVETEAYRRDDEASHSFRGQTPRNAAMFGAPGGVYVYRSYGIHWCVNIVCEPRSAVLIRALQPTHGINAMMVRRGTADQRRLCAGPGNLCQALNVNLDMNGASILSAPFALIAPALKPPLIACPRIGISKAIDHPWRFVIAGSAYLSKPVPRFTASLRGHAQAPTH